MNIGILQQIGLYALLVVVLAINGIALWHAAKNNQRNWFIVLLVIHGTIILEVAYLFFFAKKKFDYRTLFFWKK